MPDTSVKFFHSGMANAPVLNGVAGSLISLLDACLKDGFDTKTLTSLVVAAGVATATYAGTHSAVQDAVVLIAGVTGGPTGYATMNGEQKVTAKPSATQVQWATTLPDGTYTGTVTMKMAPAGWLKPFSGTNLAAYKSGAPESTGCLLRVDDTNAQYARVVGYESMSDINTGVGAFPTSTQMSGGGYWPKAMASNTTAVPWSIVCDGRIFYLNVLPGVASVANYLGGSIRGFGDVVPYKPGGDAYACVLNYSVNNSVQNMYDGSWAACSEFLTAMPRAYTGLGSCVLHSVYPYIGAGAGLHYSGISNIICPFPSVIDGSLILTNKYVQQSGGSPRGLMPGILNCPQSLVWNTFKHNDRVPGSGAYAGKTLLAASTVTSNTFTSTDASNIGAVFFDITGPWR
jgi:hypothetical protein